MKVWIDGRIVDAADAKVSVTDHGLLYGDGVFEGIRAYRGKIADLAIHLQRLERSARAIYLPLSHSSAALQNIVLDTVRAHGDPNAYVRLVVTRGVGLLGLDLNNCTESQVICIAGTIALYAMKGAGISMATVSWRRPDPDVLETRVKSLNYLNNVLAKNEAKLRGADEALVLNRRGTVAEASGANIFVLQQGRLLTPPAVDGALEGITRARVLRLAEKVGVEAREQTLTRYDVLNADEAFLTGTGAGLVPISKLDGQLLAGSGKLCAELHAAMLSYIEASGTPVTGLASDAA